MERRTIKLDELMLNELGRLASLEDAIGAQVDTGALNQLSMALTSLGHAAREKLQEATARDVQRVIDTLERDGEVSQQDRELIRGWIVGDATTYLRVENDYKGWLFELRRLVGEIADARNGDLSLEQLQSLRGNIRDALRTAADIHYYREQAERVERFESAAKEWSANQKLILAGALRRMLVSSES